MRIRKPRPRAAIAIVAIAASVVATGVALATFANAETTQFTVVNGAIRPATGTPRPASGTHASLWSNSSYATTTVDGSGRVLVGAIGDNCQGWPTVRVSVDGRARTLSVCTSGAIVSINSGSWQISTYSGFTATRQRRSSSTPTRRSGRD